MKDELEKYIQKHKQELDTHEPPAGLWDQIEKELAPQKEEVAVISIRRSYLLRAVAGIALLAALAFGWYQFQPTQPDPGMTTTTNPNYPAEFAEVEVYYASMIEKNRRQLDAFKSEDLGVDKEFFNQVDELDQMYKELKKELARSNNQELVLQAMLSNLMMQTEVLTQQLKILNDIKSRKTAPTTI